MIPILLYHRIAEVSERQDPLGLAVPLHLFARQMRSLHQSGYKCISLEEAVRRWRYGLHRSTKSLVLTFDDGYRDFYTRAWPILDGYGYTATVFLVASRMGADSNWEQQVGSVSDEILSWGEARELSRLGVTFGSHTLTHPRLTSLDNALVTRELQESKAMIEDQLGTGVHLFSYPYGDHDARVQSMVAESGYIAACGVSQGRWGLLNLWRAQCLRETSLGAFRWNARGGYHLRMWLREQSFFGGALKYLSRAIKRDVIGKRNQTGQAN